MVQDFVKYVDILGLEFQHLSQILNYGKAPPVHKSVFINVSKVNPAIFPYVEPSRGDQNVQVRMKVQTPAERVGYHEDDWCHPVLRLDPPPNNGSCKDSNIAQQTTV